MPGGSAEPRGAESEAFEAAVGALSRKERTLAELSAWLAGRGFGSEDVEEAIERLVAVGELDDERFAQRFAQDKRDLRGWGPERIRGALAERGVAAELIDAALADDSHGQQLERAVELLARRGETPDGEAARARALAYLTRRGYDYELAYEAVRRAAA
jgi:regulatory protein